jgi:Na+/melibiose symporter-like transporter
MFIDICLILIEGKLNMIVIYFITSNIDESELFPFIRNAVIHVLLIVWFVLLALKNMDR